MTHLQKFLAELVQDCNTAHRHICDLASRKKNWCMSIPVRSDDSDMTLQAPLDKLELLLRIVEAQSAALMFYADGNSWYRPGSCDKEEKANYVCSRQPQDLTEKGVGPSGLAGHIARQAQAEVEEMLK